MSTAKVKMSSGNNALRAPGPKAPHLPASTREVPTETKVVVRLVLGLHAVLVALLLSCLPLPCPDDAALSVLWMHLFFARLCAAQRHKGFLTSLR